MHSSPVIWCLEEMKKIWIFYCSISSFVENQLSRFENIKMLQLHRAALVWNHISVMIDTGAWHVTHVTTRDNRDARAVSPAPICAALSWFIFSLSSGSLRWNKIKHFLRWGTGEDLYWPLLDGTTLNTDQCQMFHLEHLLLIINFGLGIVWHQV